MANPFEISEHFTDAFADLNPVGATYYGIPGRDHLCTDFSPEGHEERASLYRSTLAELQPHLDSLEPLGAFGARVLCDWLIEQIEEFESQKWRRDLNHIHSPFQRMQDIFDVMPRDTPEAWEAICSRLEGFDGMLAGYRGCLEQGISAGDTVAWRQAQSGLEQLEAAASDESRFLAYADAAAKVGADVDRVIAAADAARTACGSLADWLEREYLPNAREEDVVGREEYLRGADEFLGMDIDPEETYAWGWDEISRIRSLMTSTAAEIDPYSTVEEVIGLLETDPDRAAASREEFVEFVARIQHQAIDQLAGEHFDVPAELRTVTVNIAPPGGSLGAWYVSPSEDMSRPGSIWYAPGERELLPYWQEVSTAYHEGFPGHHLRVGTAVLQR